MMSTAAVLVSLHSPCLLAWIISSVYISACWGFWITHPTCSWMKFKTKYFTSMELTSLLQLLATLWKDSVSVQRRSVMMLLKLPIHFITMHSAFQSCSRTLRRSQASISMGNWPRVCRAHCHCRQKCRQHSHDLSHKWMVLQRYTHSQIMQICTGNTVSTYNNRYVKLTDYM